MPSYLVIRRPLSGPVAAVLSLALAIATARLAHGSVLTTVPDCAASGDSLKCHLLAILNFLYVVAGVLGFVLILVGLLAYNSYRKNKTNEKVGP